MSLWLVDISHLRSPWGWSLSCACETAAEAINALPRAAQLATINSGAARGGPLDPGQTRLRQFCAPRLRSAPVAPVRCDHPHIGQRLCTCTRFLPAGTAVLRAGRRACPAFAIAGRSAASHTSKEFSTERGEDDGARASEDCCCRTDPRRRPGAGAGQGPLPDRLDPLGR